MSNGYTYVKLEVNSRQLIDALGKWGIVENKTFSLSFPDIPFDFMHSFIRGYFDGDGTVYWRHRGTYSEVVCRFTSGSQAFLEGMKDSLTNLGIRTNNIYKNGSGNTYVLPLSSAKQNIYAFAQLIYSNASVFLERKRVEFEPLYRINLQ